MTAPEPGQDMMNRTGWVSVSCDLADRIRARGVVRAGSTLTDMGRVIFTEWWADDVPVLRDYLWNPHTEHNRCEHYSTELVLIDVTGVRG